MSAERSSASASPRYPSGLGISDVSELRPDLVNACANIRIGTKLFGKVYRIVTNGTATRSTRLSTTRS
ncbi:hypothetical protein GCM10010869_05920 [Mesorhizobium tianshanense]|nr:hypothetical protein GCM10010869_05920 [Mesorhizobium tianshanense]